MIGTVNADAAGGPVNQGLPADNRAAQGAVPVKINAKSK